MGPGESPARAAVGRVGGCAAPRVCLRAGAEARGRRASRAVAVTGPTGRRPQSGPGAPAGRTPATGESTRPRRLPRGRCGERRRRRAPGVGVAAAEGHGGGLRVLSFRVSTGSGPGRTTFSGAGAPRSRAALAGWLKKPGTGGAAPRLPRGGEAVVEKCRGAGGPGTEGPPEISRPRSGGPARARVPDTCCAEPRWGAVAQSSWRWLFRWRTSLKTVHIYLSETIFSFRPLPDRLSLPFRQSWRMCWVDRGSI